MKTPGLIVSNVEDILCIRKANKISREWDRRAYWSADSKKRGGEFLPHPLNLADSLKTENYSALQKLRS
ncbi:MAG: hypothetical protein OJF51_000445 [Nitrospira sp.]|jgi:predicted PolB exonuclease-like 3'-5' exonuclease|nr:MAG: hypothetical protein OJF51_000445 [Nitrospira sp.]